MMRWIWVKHHARPLDRRRVLLWLLCLYLLYGLACWLPAVIQAQHLSGHIFSLDGRVLSVTRLAYGSRLVMRQNNGIRLLLYWSGSEAPGAGSHIQALVTARRPSGRRNPGGFDEAAWMASQGIFLMAEPTDPQAVTWTPAPLWSPRRLAETLRRGLRDALERLLPQASADLMAALLFGDTSGLNQATRIDFQKAGLAHLTAVSGLHLSSLMLPVNALLRRKGLPAVLRYRILIVVLLFFGLLTGWRTSVVRAVVMSVAALCGRLVLRRTQPLYALSVAVILLLLGNPFAVLGSGFWMTVCATAAVIRCTGPLSTCLSARLPWLPPGCSQALAVVFSAQLGSSWWSIRLSGDWSLPGLLLNVPAGFLTGLILWLGLALLPFGLLAAVPGPVQLPLALLSWPLQQLLRLLSALAGWAARIRFGRIYAVHLNPFWTLALLLLLIWLLNRLELLPLERLRPSSVIWRWLRRCLPSARGRRRLACLVIAGCLWQGCVLLTRPPVRVWFLDVGQGDAILIVDRSGRTVLIDGGRPGQGLTVIQPALDALGISRVDLTIATHGHADHIGGLAELVDYRRVGLLVLAEGLSLAVERAVSGTVALDAASAGLHELLLQAELTGVAVQTVAPHDTIALGRHIDLTVLAPVDDPTVRREALSDGNAWSLILLAVLGSSRLLLTADCTASTEQRLSGQQDWPAADVLKVAHHGSGQTTGQAFLQQVRPQLAVITVGQNRYGHPSDDVLQHLQQADCLVYRTDEHGAIRLDCRTDRLSIRTYVR